MATTKNTLGGAPQGNNNAAKAKIWSDAIRKVVVQKQALDQLALALVEKALSGDLQALKELGDRLEGKPVQAVEQKTEHSGEVTVYKWLDE
jgi:hypothetical protein